MTPEVITRINFFLNKYINYSKKFNLIDTLFPEYKSFYHNNQKESVEAEL